MIKPFLWIGLLVLSNTALAQQSSSYKVQEHVVNLGGSPNGGAVLTSPNFRVTLDSVGQPLGLLGIGSNSFTADLGFSVPYPPPGEVIDLTFTSETQLQWAPEISGGGYNLYRDLVGSLAGLGYGTCVSSMLTTNTATDTTTVPAGSAFFYLVTAENRLAEEGTKGFQSSSMERMGTTCP